MSNFINQRIDRAIAKGLARAGRLIDAGEHDQARIILNQVLDRDHESPAPHILAMRSAMASGNWPDALRHAELALRTRPHLEGRAFSCGIDISYAGLADNLETICGVFADADEEQARNLLSGGRPKSVLHYYQGLADHIRGRYATAREHYRAVLRECVVAHYFVAQTLNLLAALEQQDGAPENANRWIDRERYPLELQPLGAIGGSAVDTFNAGLFDEIMASTKLQPWHEY